ncbi:MAG: c-type cytochrome, partial [Aureliella sp.]
HNPSPLVLVNVLKAWEDTQPQPAAASDQLRRVAIAALASDTPQIVLAAAAALAQQGTAEDVRTLLAEILKRPADGSVTRHAMRIAVKTLLRQSGIADRALAGWILESKFTTEVIGDRAEYTDAEASELASILSAVDSPRAAEALLSYVLSSAEGSAAFRGPALKLASKHMSPLFADAVVSLLEQLAPSQQEARATLFSESLDPQTQLATEAIASLRESGQPVPLALGGLIEMKVVSLASGISERLSGAGAAKAITWHEPGGKLWQIEQRAHRGESRDKHSFFSSFTLGETYVGMFSTSDFQCPKELSFWIVGHDGYPNMPAGNKNLARLVNADSGAVLRSAEPPRNDVARKIDWYLSQWAGQPVRFECIDGDSGKAYAWIGVGGFSLPELNPSDIDGAVAKLAGLVELNVAPAAKAELERLLEQEKLSDASRARLTAAYASSRGLGLGKLLAEVADKRGQSAAVPKAIALGEPEDYRKACHDLAVLLAGQMTLSEQSQLARGLIASADGRRLLIELVDNGQMASQSLRNLKELLGTSPEDEDSQRLAELSDAASAAPSEAEIAILKRIQAFKPQDADAERGRQVFEKNCANCHKLRGVGQLVGPQLDGAAARSFERLAEDVLLPTRTVDKAFRMSSLLLDDDRVVVGLARESADGQMQVVGSDGKIQSVDPDAVVSRRDTTRSLMPDNFAELLSDRDLGDLMQFIMQR